MRLKVRHSLHIGIDAAEVLVTGLQQLLETVDDKIGLLEIVDDVSVKPRQIMQLAELHRALATLAISLHEIGKDRIG